MPEVLARLWQMSDDPNQGAAELATVVGMDPALSAELLRAVNGARFGLPRSIDSLKEAITFLGTRTVRNLSLALVVRDGILPRRREPIQFDREAFWRHCIGTALAAESLASELDLESAPSAYAAGLLHDLGIMVLDVVAPEHLDQILQLVRMGTPIRRAEREVVGCTHAEIGRFLAESWNLSDLLLACIRDHHSPLDADRESRALACVVQIADTLVSPEGPECYSGGPCDEHDRAVAFLNLDQLRMERVRKQMDEEIKNAGEALLIAKSGLPTSGRSRA
jgi:HD-like signal output (HDOD) protein